MEPLRNLRTNFVVLPDLPLEDVLEIFQFIGISQPEILQLVDMSKAMKDGMVDCLKIFDWICDTSGDQADNSSNQDQISPTSQWLEKDEIFEFQFPAELAINVQAMPEELLTQLAGSGCQIPEVEDRAIELKQLLFVLACIRCGCLQHSWSDQQGRALTPEEVNLYHLVDLLVKPATAARECSFVELMAEGPQPCKWFVSHWWGEPVCDFTACLRQHSKDRNLRKATLYYWVCAYANNQWNVRGEIGEDPSDSSFRRAMRKASGTVSIVDKSAVCYTRIWCIYETYISTLEQASHTHGERYLFDIYTNENPDAREAVGITDGLAAIDGTGPKQARRKRHREWRFPFELIQKALDIRVEKAFASQEEDRRMILNSIAGLEELTLPPAEVHEGYNLLNNVLHGRFSAASFAKASATPGVDLARHAEALSFSLLESLTIHFGGDCLEKLMDKAVVILAENLPETLTDLFLGFQSCRKLTDMSAVALGGALHRLKKLKRLEIRLSSGPDISDEGVYALAQGLRSCAHVLEWLSLDFMGNKGKKKISEVVDAVSADALVSVAGAQDLNEPDV
ncbi:E3 ubiquitin-protein ligase TRIM71 [Durusdinium trenchii]|uniref:E3 ubiquitin-protein ligase TRIM71 n=1 Tax=Durusdinium trenchii TaxID=1381693 RepID=A0ABP0LRM7_9DINO